MNLNPETMAALERFFFAHVQHDLTIKLLSREDQRRYGAHLDVQLGCHNGHDWMGFRERCDFTEIDTCIMGNLAHLAIHRPDLKDKLEG